MATSLTRSRLNCSARLYSLVIALRLISNSLRLVVTLSMVSQSLLFVSNPILSERLQNRIKGRIPVHLPSPSSRLAALELQTRFRRIGFGAETRSLLTSLIGRFFLLRGLAWGRPWLRHWPGLRSCRSRYWLRRPLLRTHSLRRPVLVWPERSGNAHRSGFSWPTRALENEWARSTLRLRERRPWRKGARSGSNALRRRRLTLWRRAPGRSPLRWHRRNC